jgi:heme-degrading monooxygenase HmoA
VIARIWHGWAVGPNAEAYETYFRITLAAELQKVPGYRGARLLRRTDGEEVELVTITLFESIDAVRAFAGDDYDESVVSARARELLSRFDERVRHYAVVGQDEVAGS